MPERNRGWTAPCPPAGRPGWPPPGPWPGGYRTAVLLSGPEDLVSDGERAWCVTGGSDAMSRVTGTGCMLSVLCGVFAAVEPDAAAAAVLASALWKVCARRAERLAGGRGSGSFRAALMDAAGTLTAADAAREAEIAAL